MLRQIFRREVTTTQVDVLIDDVLDEMKTAGPDSETYPKLLSHLERLNKLKTQERQPPVSRDTMMTVFGNLAGILVIVAYEQKHVITSKGFSQILRPKNT